MNINNSIISAGVLATALTCSLGAAQAAPLPNGTLLPILSGGDLLPDGECTTGSCFAFEIFAGTWVWIQLAPGNDGGIVVGKNQLSGGQDLVLPGTATSEPGDLTAAWSFLNAWGTLSADQAQNVYSDTSNSGETAINDLHFAWNGSDSPIGGGTVDSYTVSPDGSGGLQYTLDYSTVVQTGAFEGVRFRLSLRSALSAPPGNTAPVVNDVVVDAESAVLTEWIPDFTGDVGDTHTCSIVSNAGNGNATVNTDCSIGTYISGTGFEGTDGFTYSVTDQYRQASQGTVTVNVILTPAILCANTFPIKQVSSFGGGQGSSVNSTLVTTFTGYIITEAGLTSGGKNTVRICPGTTVDYKTVSSVGGERCTINGSPTAATGKITVGDKLICTNKPDGGDVDRFAVKSGL